MFDYDKWQEIFGTIKRNKLRTGLTILGIFWGIFMIIILLGGSNSFKNGVTKNFGNFLSNSGFFWGQKTTISYNGFQPGKYVNFNNSDTEFLLSRVKELKALAPRNNLWGVQINHGEKSGQYQVMGDYPEYSQIEKQEMTQGRFINQKDIDESRKVAVIGENVRNVLFEKDEDPIGKFITVRKVNFLVVGVMKPYRTNPNSQERNRIHVPFTTFQKAFHFGDRVGWYGYAVEDNVDVAEVEAKILKLMKEKNNIHPLDADAIGHENLQEEFGEIYGMFNGLEYFTWFVGLSTLFAGIIGVSNIMLIIVKERTKEIGIRKSLGATPLSIISLIVQESMFLTFLGGYLALIIGLLLLEGVAMVMPKGGQLPFDPPSINPAIALGALGILLVGGLIASILPARKAASINPIEAIRTEG